MKELKTALKLFLFFTVLTGIIYPVLITGIAQLFMSDKANGSLIKRNEKIIGSSLIAQKMTGDKYFWPRPSAIDYNPIFPSGGSNLGPTSQRLKDLLIERKTQFGNDAPAEMLFASGSGLDPHISLQTAYFQAHRIALARSVDEKTIHKIIEDHSEGFKSQFHGQAYANVLLLNLALEKIEK